MGAFIFILFLIGIDQLSKYIVVLNLKGNEPLIIIDNFLSFFYLENRGAAFGILQGRKMIFSIITIIVLIVLFSVLYKNYHHNSSMLKFTASLLIGGSIGNFIDRIRLDYVVDFISLNIFGYDFAVFNIADMFIVIGTLLLVIMIILHDNPSKEKNVK